MKKLLVRERILAIGAKYDVTDENNNNIFYIEADKFDIGKNIHVYSQDKSTEYYYLEQTLRIGAHKYKLFDGNKNKLGIIEKEFMIPNYGFDCQLGSFKMKGANFLGRAYEITRNDVVVGRFEKPITFFTDYYELEIYDESITPLIVALAILIDMVRFHRN